MDIIFIIAVPITVTIAVTIVPSHGISPIIVSRITSVRADFSSFIAGVVLIITIAFSPSKLAFTLVLPVAGSTGKDQWCRWWCLLNDNFLRLSSLADHNRSTSCILRGVVLGFFADTFDLMTVRIIIAFFCALLNPDLFITPTSVPIAPPLPVLVAASAISADTGTILAIIVAIAVVS
jgi:hypothetical protein